MARARVSDPARRFGPWLGPSLLADITVEYEKLPESSPSDGSAYALWVDGVRVGRIDEQRELKKSNRQATINGGWDWEPEFDTTDRPLWQETRLAATAFLLRAYLTSREG